MTRRTGSKIAAALMALAIAGTVMAQTATAPQSEPKRKVQHTQTTATGEGAQQVAVDPATGALGAPTAEQIQALERAVAAMLSQSSEGLEVVELPDGTLTVDLLGRFQEVAVAAVAPDGTLRTGCVSRPGEVRAVLAPEARAVAKKAAPAVAPLEVR